jgi:hypothetical protein
VVAQACETLSLDRQPLFFVFLDNNNETGWEGEMFGGPRWHSFVNRGEWYVLIPITFRSVSTKPREAPPEQLSLLCLFQTLASSKPTATAGRLVRFDDLFQWKAPRSPNKQALILSILTCSIHIIN